MKRLLFIISTLLMFCSCNNPMDKTYSSATYEDDIQAIRKSEKIDENDIELLAKYILVAQLSGNDLRGKTYTDILDKIKDVRKSNDDALDKQKNEEEFNRQRLGRLLTVSLREKSFSKNDNKEYLDYTIAFTNTSGQDIKMVIGNISIRDLLDKEIKKVDVMLEQPLHTGATLKKVYNVIYDHANENDQRIRMKDLIDMRVEWNPSKIVFENGSVAE